MQSWLKPLLFVALAAMGALAISQGWLDLLADQQALSRYLQEHGLSGLLLIAAGGVLYTGLGGPRQLLAFVCGFAMGALLGTLFSSLVTILGAAACFYTSRLLLRPTLMRRFERRMAIFDRAIARKPLFKIMLVRLMPVGSNLLTNLLAGASGIRVWPFLTGSALGYLPQMIVFALAGAGIGNANEYSLLLGAALLLVAVMAGAMLSGNPRIRDLTLSVSEKLR